MFRLIAPALLGISLSAQTPSVRDEELSRAAKNPYDLARFIDSHLGFDWDVLWKALVIQPLLIQPCGKLSNGKRQCSTELITVLHPDQIILIVQGDATPADIYFRFLQEKSGSWRFAGAFWAAIHNHPRRHEVDRSTGKPFLRVSSQGLRGSDVDSEIEDWFDLTQSGFDPVFSFTVQGYQQRFGFGISRRIVGTIIAQKNAIDVVLDVHFEGSDNDGKYDLGTTDYRAVYTQARGAKLFTLQTVDAWLSGQTKLSLVEFEALADLDQGPSEEDLIRYNILQLSKIASGRDSATKRWLKQFLTRVKDTPAVRELKALLR